MPELSAEILLRPTRVGFLTSPTDLAGVRAIMRACTCLWGGIYNPIIPVFKSAPKEWRPEIYKRFKGAEVAKGYIRFFEPDIYVETKRGLLEDAGLGALREKHTLYPQVITLKEFLQPEQGHTWSEPALGLGVFNVLSHIYQKEQQFVRRDKQENLYVSPEAKSGATEAMFGVYPTMKAVKYIEQAYRDVYQPENAKPTPETWRRIFLKGAGFPLRVTQYSLEAQRYWHHDLLVFVFDPTRATDLIDLWNLRLEPHPILPVPFEWFEELGDDIYEILKAEHRPIVGNPHGVMHNATIEFGRSIPRPTAESLIRSLKPGLPAGAVVVKYWRNAIWVERRDDRVHRDSRLKVTCKERHLELVLKDEGRALRTSFESLEPEFAERYSRGGHRWVNVLSISQYGDQKIATVLPFNTFDRSWPTLDVIGEAKIVSSEGWVFPQQYPNYVQPVSLLSTNDAIVGSLERLGFSAKLSEPGHIARQMLEQLGGLWGVYLLADIDTLELLNKMAGGVRRRSNESEVLEETFELRTAPLKDWVDLIARRRARHPLPRYDLEDFTKQNVIRLGLETECPHCNVKNWSSLTDVGYRVTCERCLKPYDFPQAALREQNRNFTYRVIGPFSTPDYARGAYSTLLTLRVLEKFNSSTREITFSTAMDLSFDGLQREVDFVAWYGDERMGREFRRPPQLIIGETKSLAQGELIKRRDLARLKSVAEKLPDAIVVIAVLRDQFTPTEKVLLREFVNWGRRVNTRGEPSNPVLLLTALELTMDFRLSQTWSDFGGKHDKIDTFEHINKHLVLVVQDCLLDYMKNEFNFGHLSEPSKLGDSMHFHSYRLSNDNRNYKISLDKRLSTDSEGMATCLGLQAEAKIELDDIIKNIEAKISDATLLPIV